MAAGLVLIWALAGCAELTELLGPDSREHEPDVVYDPTPPKVVDAMLELAQVKPGDRLYDLVITSYSIHYTKLYEAPNTVCSKDWGMR